MNSPEANVRSRKPMSLKQLLECGFDHRTSQVLDRDSQDDSQLPFPMLESNFFDMLGINESFKVNNLRIQLIGSLCAEEESGGAVGANSIANDCLDGVIDVVASRANLDSQHQCQTARICSNEICRPLQRRYGSGAPKPGDGGSLHITAEAHVRD